jgi:TetR/AcrR family transcriptional repressor of lmrAB and yxaGH operons
VVGGEQVSPRVDVRSNMVEGAVRLLATEGVEGTSFKEVLALSNAPRGSVYHHFPGGKSELLHAALDLVSERAFAQMEAVRGQTAVFVLEHFLGLWRQLLTYSRLTAGCAVVSATVVTPEDGLLGHAGTIFRTWADQLTDLFVEGGMDRAPARRMSNLAISATEGAVLLSRAQQSLEPFDEVADSLLQVVELLP